MNRFLSPAGLDRYRPILLLVAFVFSGCMRKEDPALRIGMNIWPGYEIIYLAQEKGFYRDEGIHVRILEFNSLADVRRAYELGRLDGIAATLIDVLMARDAADRDLRVHHVFDFSSGADAIIARAEFGSISDLRGRRIGFEQGSLGVYLLARALEKHGLKLSDIIPVSKDQRSMVHELEESELDAIVTYAPESVRLARDPRFRQLFDSQEIPGEVVDVLGLDADVVKERPAQVAAFQRAVNRAYRYMMDHPDDAFRIMSEREHITPGEFRQVIENEITLVSPDEQHLYFGPENRLANIVASSARYLGEIGAITSIARVTNCLPAP